MVTNRGLKKLLDSSDNDYLLLFNDPYYYLRSITAATDTPAPPLEETDWFIFEINSTKKTGTWFVCKRYDPLPYYKITIRKKMFSSNIKYVLYEKKYNHKYQKLTCTQSNWLTPSFDISKRNIFEFLLSQSERKNRLNI